MDNSQKNVVVVLNKVDQHIKRCLLRYPTIMSSRMDVLQNMFMSNGTGYEWNEKGFLENVFDDLEDNDPVQMDYSDLIEEENKLEIQMSEDAKSGNHLASFYAARRCNLEQQFWMRQHIESNIDIYATKHVQMEDMNCNIHWLKHFDPNWCAVSLSENHKFPTVMDKDCAMAAEEILKIARSAINRELGMYYENFNRDKANPKWLRIYDQVGAILDKLDVFTGTKKRDADLAEFSRKLMSKISEDDGETPQSQSQKRKKLR